jgi:tetratricopeptide (TPR) repeat protein
LTVGDRPWRATPWGKPGQPPVEHYFRGLNYLLSEQPDKAIELFLHIAELDRKRSKPRWPWAPVPSPRRSRPRHPPAPGAGAAPRPERCAARAGLLALGEDYMKSGLLDRAETVFSDLAKIDQRARCSST